MKTSRDYIKDDLDLLEASTGFIKGDGYKEKVLEDIEEFAGDGLTDYQKGLIREMAKCDYECGGCVDPYEESFKELLWEDEDLCDDMEEAQDYYQELANMGPAGFYEAFQDEFDWDPDFVAQYSGDLEESIKTKKRVKESTEYQAYDLTMQEEAEMDEAYESWYAEEEDWVAAGGNPERNSGGTYLFDAVAFKEGYRANHDDGSTEDELEALACSYFDMMNGETTHHGSWCAGWKAISIHPENEKKEFDPYAGDDLGDLEDGPCGALADDENSAFYQGSYDYSDGGFDDYYESKKRNKKSIKENRVVDYVTDVLYHLVDNEYISQDKCDRFLDLLAKGEVDEADVNRLYDADADSINCTDTDQDLADIVNYYFAKEWTESKKASKKSIKEKRVTSVKTPTEWFKVFNNIFLEIKDKFPNLGVTKEWDGNYPAKISISKLDLELQFELSQNNGYYSGSMRAYFGKEAYGEGEPLVAWNSGDYEEFETDAQDAIEYLTGVCESRGSKINESKKGKKSIKENASDTDIFIVTPDWDQYPCDEHGNPDGWDPREEAEYFTKLENAAIACGMQTGFIPFSDGDPESGMCAPESDGTWQATPAMLRQFIEEYDLPIKVYEQGVDGEVGEEIFDYQSLAFEADPIETEYRDMGEMYGLPRGASSEEALKFFESKKRIKEMNIGGDGYAVYVKDGKTLLTHKMRGSGKMENKIILEPYYVEVFDGEEQKAKEELKKLVSKKEASIFSRIEKEYKIIIVDSLPKSKILDNKNV